MTQGQATLLFIVSVVAFVAWLLEYYHALMTEGDE